MTLITTTEAGRILGWSRGKTSVYRRRGLLPEPVQYLGHNQTRPVWRREDIVGYSVVCALCGPKWQAGPRDSAIFRNSGMVAILRQTYGIPADERIGAALVAQGVLTPEQGGWLDRQLGEAE